jgi:DNA-binding CsgD family transcriptional regulator
MGMTGQDRPLHEAIRAHRWLLDALLQQFPDGSINVFDRDLRYLYAAGTGHARLGLVPEALTGRRLDDLFPAEPIARVRAFCRRAFTGETVTFTLSIFGREYVIRAWPLAEPDAAISAIVAVAREVPTPLPGVERLTRRQREVAALVAARLTNGQIAERLMLGTGTVRNYVAEILQQLGFVTRTQLGVWAASCGLYRPDEERTSAEVPSRWPCRSIGSDRDPADQRPGEGSTRAPNGAHT